MNLRPALLDFHREYYASAKEVARQNDVKAYVVSMTRDRTRAQKLKELLHRHRIQMHELARDFESEGLRYTAGDAYVVPVDQPQARLVKAAFETLATFTDSLFYDVSTWTLPLAFDVDYAEIRTNPRNYLGDVFTEAVVDGGALEGGASSYGYMMKWDRYFAPRALHRVLQAGFFPRLLHHPVQAETASGLVQFERGSIFIPARHRDLSLRHLDDQLFGLLESAVAEDHVQIYALTSGYTPQGPDLGSGSSTVLHLPEIALITGSGTSAYNAGEVWHLLTERFEIPISLLEANRVQNANLDRYSTIVMAGGSYSGLDIQKLTDWVRSGGTLITLSSASDWAVRNNMLDLERKSADLDSLYQDLPFDQLDEARGAQFIGGAIVEAQLDTTHPLAYTFRETMPLFRRGTSFYEASERPGTNVAIYGKSPLLSGYISEERLEMIPGSAALVAHNMGRGSLIAFMDNPNFRAFWYGTNRLFLNAIFFRDAF